ncbi:MAG TPA: acyl-CoA dehydrogenase family protein [Acidimicrobiales bacterium]|nr:acyl-CoA dehydrogenase family protein [Acidimicrobiales bacterium]
MEHNVVHEEGRGLLAPVTSPPLSEVDVFDPRRDELRRWLTEHPHPSGRELAEAGLVAPSWPAPWGLDASVDYQLLIEDELRRAGVSRPINPIGIGWAGPTILVAGTPTQKERWLAKLLSGEEFWCQLFSEPDAGSDLASLSTSATRDGDEWVISGQKIWTSYAHLATWGILLARTSREGAPQDGISYFILPMHAAGVTIRPLVDMTGDHAFNEVFLDEVRLSDDYLLGEVNQGWRLAKVTLGNERVALSGEGVLWGRGPTANDLLDVVRKHGGDLSKRERDDLVRCWSHGEILRFLRLRLTENALAGRATGSDASLRKALADDHGQEVMELANRLAQSAGMLANHGPCGLEGEEGRSWYWGFLYAQALTIGGGTSVVQRNIIAERVLGLPKDASATP